MTRSGQFLVIGLSLAAGFAAASYLAGSRQDTAPAAPAAVYVPPAFDSSAPVETRVEALEQALNVERHARQLLQEEVMILTDTIDALRAGDVAAAEPELRQVQSLPEQNSRRGRDPEERRLRRAESLVAAGFSVSEAESILRRESELQMEALQARYDAQRSGESTAGLRTREFLTNTLRQELGDTGYERYLEANGRPTAISISTVFEGSPALAAGLQPGDQITRYDGRRVFNMNEITTLTMQGQAGERVAVDIVRDGVLMQVSIPRGPMGVTGGRRFRR